MFPRKSRFRSINGFHRRGALFARETFRSRAAQRRRCLRRDSIAQLSGIRACFYLGCVDIYRIIEHARNREAFTRDRNATSRVYFSFCSVECPADVAESRRIEFLAGSAIVRSRDIGQQPALFIFHDNGDIVWRFFELTPLNAIVEPCATYFRNPRQFSDNFVLCVLRFREKYRQSTLTYGNTATTEQLKSAARKFAIRRARRLLNFRVLFLRTMNLIIRDGVAQWTV